MVEVFQKTMGHFFPSFLQWLRMVKDPREKSKIDYPLPNLVWVGILLFLLKLEARRQIKFRFNTAEFIHNLNLLTKVNLEKVAHPDTLEYLLEKLPPETLSHLRVKMVNRLIRMKCLEKFRLLGKYYLIAIDGTGHLVFNERHCEHCLVQKKGGKVLYYYHNVLEAKLVTANGLALSIATEFIENTGEEADRQDCELRAFYRLVKQLKKDFPQLHICLLLDSLYAAGPVFTICRNYHWQYLITFKQGSMPEVYTEYLNLRPLYEETFRELKEGERRQNFNWVTGIDYQEHRLNVLECNESQSGKESRRFVWLTNLAINQDNFQQIAKGGRLRWKTENEGFNTQKNGGYNLEHAYSEDEVAAKNFYLLLQIAHTINQLMEKGSLLKDQIKEFFGSIRNIARKLLEDLRTKFIDLDQLQRELATPCQIRFLDSS
ncbi:MAG: hypothetical protein ACE5EE_11065 [Fidelibacterota bacterium]